VSCGQGRKDVHQHQEYGKRTKKAFTHGSLAKALIASQVIITILFPFYVGDTGDLSISMLDLHPRGSWIDEPETKGKVDMGARETKIIEGCFSHKDCKRVSMSGAPFDDLTCTRCARIPQEVDFRH
jgi:hypothetical protein